MLVACIQGTRDLCFASKGLKAVSPDCGESLITKCGTFIQHHFAHKPGSECVSQKYDGKTDWHMEWQMTIKNPQAGINVEVPCRDGCYLKRADLVTPSGLIIEFQYSPMPIEERVIRENHYKNMIWVIHENLKSSQTFDPYYSEKHVFIDYGEKGLLDLGNNQVIPKSKFIRSIVNGHVFNEEILKKINERHFMVYEKAGYKIFRYDLFKHFETSDFYNWIFTLKYELLLKGYEVVS